MTDFDSPFAIRVDTDSYAGNFEREATAYATGQIGECEVGRGDADRFGRDVDASLSFDHIIAQVADEHGCFRPTSICLTPNVEGYTHNSFYIFFYQRPMKEQIELIQTRLQAWFKSDSLERDSIHLLGIELMQKKVEYVSLFKTGK